MVTEALLKHHIDMEAKEPQIKTSEIILCKYNNNNNNIP